MLLIDDLLWGVRLSLGLIGSDSGATHSGMSTQDSVAYVEHVHADYRTYGGWSTLSGTAVEIGPGDNAGVALLMRHDGCERVDLVDRYRSNRDPLQQETIYETLDARHGLTSLRVGDRWRDDALAGIHWCWGVAAEAFFQRAAQTAGPSYDTIVSRSALEHLFDPLGALRSMVTCLRPGGVMAHKIDLRDHGLFSTVAHELTLLTFPAWLHRLMTQNSGRPNRVLVHHYRALLDELKAAREIDYTIFVCQLVGSTEIQPHREAHEIDGATWATAESKVDEVRSRLASEFATVSSRDLAVSVIFVRVVKRAP